MPATKTLQVREKELQALLVDAAGRQQLQELASQIHALGSNPKPPRTSIITYILVHERERGLIAG